MPKSDYIYYIENRQQLDEKHDGKVIVIVNSKVMAEYPSMESAYDNVFDKFEAGTFLLQKCSTSTEPSLKYSLSTRRLE